MSFGAAKLDKNWMKLKFLFDKPIEDNYMKK